MREPASAWDRTAMAFDPLELARRAVPRYTSYPTAPHFTAAIGPATYADWLSELQPDIALSLYLHVPFCRDLCLYCGCHTKAVRRREPLEEYAATMRREIALLAGRVGRRRLSHIHWGGGTPSTIGVRQLEAIHRDLDARFDLCAVREHAIELDPRHVSAALVAALARIGLSRASLGVQELAPHVQHAIGRIQPYDVVARSVELLRSAGIDRLNFDLMYGLPRQSIDDVRSTAERACELRPQRIALFGYAHVPWFKKRQRLIDQASLPGTAERLAQMQSAREVFLSRDYSPIGFDHFALPDDSLARAAATGRLRRNFQGYTSDDADALVGLGASAISRLPAGYAQNAVDIGGYRRAIGAETFATSRGRALALDDRIRARIIERIMCDLFIDLRALGSGEHELTAELDSLRPLVAEGLVELGSGFVRVTERGRPFVRLVASAFDRYLADSAMQSAAI